MITDLIVIVIATGAGYVLAGYTLRPIQRSVEAQRVFAENASHELRTPLAVMRNDMEVLLRDSHPTNESVRFTLKNALEEIQGMSKMTEDLLVLARLGKLDIENFNTIGLSNLIHDLAERLKPLALAKGIAINVVLDDSISISGNAGDIERVVSNLIQNSIEHTLSGGMITLKTAIDGARASISVSDTGSGIDEKDIPHIFERFYKGKSSSGTGLGLSIAKEIVERHHGEISADSVNSKGTIITIRLPLV